MKPCDKNIRKTLLLTEEMIRLSEKGDAEREDIGCGILYGVLRDSAYKLKRLAEEEVRKHKAKGWWKSECPKQDNNLNPEKERRNGREI